MPTTTAGRAELLWKYHHLRLSGADPGDLVKLRNRIVTENRGLSQEEAHRWIDQCSEPFEDLEQEGCFGLIKAVDGFNPNTGNAFSSFAIPKIRGAILHYLRDKGWGVVRPPRRVVEKCAEVARDAAIAERYGRAIDLDECARLKGIPTGKWREMSAMRSRKPVLELDETLCGAAGGLEPGESLERENQRRWLFSRLGTVPAPQRSCLMARYFGDRPVQAIAKHYRVSVVVVEIWIEQGLQALRSAA